MFFVKFIISVALLLVHDSQADYFDDYIKWLQASSVKPDVHANPSPTAFRDSCETPDKREGRCVRPSECNQIEEKIDPTTLFDIRSGSCHYLRPCCPYELIRENEIEPEREEPTTLGCGWTNPGANMFRSGQTYNHVADFGEFRWMVALLKITSDSGVWRNPDDYIGGGSLIHPSVVLTVAHYAADKTPDMIKCRAGEWDTRTVDEVEPHQDREVRKIKVHPEYISAKLYNDAALLLLKEPFNLYNAPHIGVGCLGYTMPPPNTICYSMGWGKEEFKGREYANILKKVQLPLVSKDQCETAFKRTLNSDSPVHNSWICAGGVKGSDTCTGDGGSSLVCPIQCDGEPRRYAIYGMVAFGVGCGDSLPAGYVNIPHVYNWIVRSMRDEALNETSFVPEQH
ncbi:unnamed protein product [Leptidea sinapis]|uniref:Peptidase S1 domain-containing protein n=1 Tax=Leptidea sinapis TaxID=189913 RepID=A0A5E4QK58_9NEOP|nr:unnamed protein product [Leptidea sinapis]